MTGAARPCIVAGYDGSEPARAAVVYAAGRVGPGGRLYIVYAGDERARLDELMLEAGNELIDTDYELVHVPGAAAAEALVEAARTHEADEIMIGSRGQGRLGSVLGSVAQQVLHIADRPVVVLPAQALREPAKANG